MSVTVKLCLEDEVRRVPLGEKENPVNYTQFLRAVAVTFPRTIGSALELTWVDEDGDTITFSTESEFMEAMRCMGTGVPKFYVKILKGRVAPNDGAFQPSPTASTIPTEPNPTVHVNVECDSCGMLPIVGVRYKSAFRDNYDLCEACEKKLGPREPMIKLTKSVENTPQSPNLANILHGTIDHAVTALDCLLNSEETKRVLKECNEKAVSPLVSVVDNLVSRWTRGASVPTPASSGPENMNTASTSTSGSVPSSTKPALKFLRDVSVPDGTEVSPGTILCKEWLVCNDGKSAWPVGATLCTAGGDMLLYQANSTKFESTSTASTEEVPTGPPICPAVQAGEERVLSVTLLAPSKPGRYVAYFRMKTAVGRRFGHRLWADIIVTSPHPAENESISVTQSSLTEKLAVSEANVNEFNTNDNTCCSIPCGTVEPMDTSNLPLPQSGSLSPNPVDSPHYAQYADAPPLYWQQELSLLSDMGFTDIETLVPLLEKFVKTPAVAISAPRDQEFGQENSTNDEGNLNNDVQSEKLRVAQGLQQVLAVLLHTRVKEVYI